MVETPLSPGNFAMTPSPGLTPEQGHALSSSLFSVPSLTRPGLQFVRVFFQVTWLTTM